MEAIAQETLLVSAVDAAKMLSISQKTLWIRTKNGEIPCCKIGSRVLYSPAKLRSWIESKMNPTNETSHDV